MGARGDRRRCGLPAEPPPVVLRDARRRAIVSVLLATLDRLSNAVIAIDEQGRSIYMNRRAQQIVELGDALTIAADGSLTPVAPEAARWLSRRLSGLNGNQIFPPTGSG